jgi:NADPH-dependent 2,4-dienoyl-CoA reductase/sulfur reductase-like enzyme
VDKGVKRAVVVGAEIIGFELVEGFVRRGIALTVVELQDQVLPPFDNEMTTSFVPGGCANAPGILQRPHTRRREHPRG